MKTQTFLALLVFGGVVFAGYKLFPMTSSPTPTASPTMTQEVTATPPVVMNPDVTLEMGNYSFSQKTLTAKAGTTMVIKVTNTEGFHDFVIDELNVKSTMLKTGESELLTIMIPADATGKSYEYYCSVGQHRANGMKGTLTIE